MNLCSQRGLKAAWLLAITLYGAPLGAQAAPWSDSLTSASLPEVSVLGGRWQTGAKPSVQLPARPMGWSASELMRSGIDLRQTGPHGQCLDFFGQTSLEPYLDSVGGNGLVCR